MYDNDAGVFYAADPAHETYSRYGYCGGNPISFVDPTGRMKAPTRYS
jgi:RHS repeat-associated protein